MEKTSVHDFVAFDIKEVHETQRPTSPVPQPYQHEQAARVETPAATVPSYTPKQGKMTVDDVEQEIAMLMERMEFLEKTLQELKKENAKDL